MSVRPRPHTSFAQYTIPHAQWASPFTPPPPSRLAQEQAGIGRAALRALAPELQAYTSCVGKHLARKDLARAPEHYTQQLAPPAK